jgi:hypothetical protein
MVSCSLCMNKVLQEGVTLFSKVVRCSDNVPNRYLNDTCVLHQCVVRLFKDFMKCLQMSAMEATEWLR